MDAREPDASLELSDISFVHRPDGKMDRIRGLFSPTPAKDPEYEGLDDGGSDETSLLLEGDSKVETEFSWTEYFIFALVGVAMLWAW